MISELAGFTLTRAIPSECLLGVVTGAYKVCGGVIRDNSGQIVAHLVNAGSSITGMHPIGAGLGVGLDAVNTFQLYKVGRQVQALQAATAQLVSLAQGTMALSGLTLAVSAAGFVFLTKKLNQIDHKLNEIAKDVKAIRAFLQSQEKAVLSTALKTLSGIRPGLDDRTRIPLLISARQRLGEIHQRYRDQFVEVDRIDDVFAVEEYYTLTALGHAMCSAELDMPGNAVTDLDEAYATWHISTRRVCTDLALGDNPERLLCSAYQSSVKSDEIIDWMDFAHNTEKGIGWIDDLREQMSPFRLPQIRLSASDLKTIEIMRKITARNRIYQGYASQYRYLETIGVRPSGMHEYVESLSPTDKSGECFVFLANQMVHKPDSLVGS